MNINYQWKNSGVNYSTHEAWRYCTLCRQMTSGSDKSESCFSPRMVCSLSVALWLGHALRVFRGVKLNPSRGWLFGVALLVSPHQVSDPWFCVWCRAGTVTNTSVNGLLVTKQWRHKEANGCSIEHLRTVFRQSFLLISPGTSLSCSAFWYAASRYQTAKTANSLTALTISNCLSFLRRSPSRDGTKSQHSR